MMKKILISVFVFTLSSCAHVETKTTAKAKGTIKPPSTLKAMTKSCKDPKGKYQPVTTILSKGSYLNEPHPYKPINNAKGFISQDFNHDKKTDFLFLERSGVKIRLISCLSRDNKHQRNITPFNVHEMIEPDYQTISESISVEGDTLVLGINKHEHNWGSDSDTRRYTYHANYNDFVLEQREVVSSSGDGLRSDTYEFYDLKNRRFKRSSVCGSYEEGCPSYDESGTLYLPKIRSTLLKPKKSYVRLKAD